MPKFFFGVEVPEGKRGEFFKTKINETNDRAWIITEWSPKLSRITFGVGPQN